MKNKYLKKIILYFLIFIISCIVGWIYEVIFYRITDNAWVNRGFLYGPYLPVYGFGGVFLVFFLDRLKNKPIILFILSMLITGILELITGLAMFKIWHRTWWDYTGLFLNIKGYVCFRSVFTFAIGAMLLIYIIKPQLLKIMNKIKIKKLSILCSGILIIMIMDLILSFLIRNKI